MKEGAEAARGFLFHLKFRVSVGSAEEGDMSGEYIVERIDGVGEFQGNVT